MSNYPNDPTGFVRTGDAGRELVIVRTFRAPADDVWASLTEPDRFARWYGLMRGEPGVGTTLMLTMTAEEDPGEEPCEIIECDPPQRLVVSLGDPESPWRMSIDLDETDGVTTMTFVQLLTDAINVVDVGPGWEFYADRLTSSRDGSAMPDWDGDGYQAALGPHYSA